MEQKWFYWKTSWQQQQQYSHLCRRASLTSLSTERETWGLGSQRGHHRGVIIIGILGTDLIRWDTWRAVESLTSVLAEYGPSCRQEHRSHGMQRKMGKSLNPAWVWTGLGLKALFSGATLGQNEIELSSSPSWSWVSRFLVWSQDHPVLPNLLALLFLQPWLQTSSLTWHSCRRPQVLIARLFLGWWRCWINLLSEKDLQQKSLLLWVNYLTARLQCNSSATVVGT